MFYGTEYTQSIARDIIEGMKQPLFTKTFFKFLTRFIIIILISIGIAFGAGAYEHNNIQATPQYDTE